MFEDFDILELLDNSTNFDDGINDFDVAETRISTIPGEQLILKQTSFVPNNKTIYNTAYDCSTQFGSLYGFRIEIENANIQIINHSRNNFAYIAIPNIFYKEDDKYYNAILDKNDFINYFEQLSELPDIYFQKTKLKVGDNLHHKFLYKLSTSPDVNVILGGARTFHFMSYWKRLACSDIEGLKERYEIINSFAHGVEDFSNSDDTIYIPIYVDNNQMLHVHYLTSFNATYNIVINNKQSNVNKFITVEEDRDNNFSNAMNILSNPFIHNNIKFIILSKLCSFNCNEDCQLVGNSVYSYLKHSTQDQSFNIESLFLTNCNVFSSLALRFINTQFPEIINKREEIESIQSIARENNWIIKSDTNNELSLSTIIFKYLYPSIDEDYINDYEEDFDYDEEYIDIDIDD